MFDALVAEEKKVYTAAASVIRGYGYASEEEDATSVYGVDLRISPDSPVPGTLAPGSHRQLPGDTAVWVRWGTSRMNAGRRIYLRKYFHTALSDSAAAADVIAPVQKTALLAFATKMDDGSFLDARKVTARGHVDTIVNHGASDFITTRTLKRRSKRVPT